MRVPKYCKHSQRDIAYVQYQHKRHYLPGPYESAQSRAAYKAFLVRIFGPIPLVTEDNNILVKDIAGAFLDHARQHYGDGTRGEYANCRHAIRHLLAHYRELPAAQFGPLKLQELQGHLVRAKLTRAYVNQVVSKVRRMFKWAVSQELVAASVFHALESVPGVRQGKTLAVESKRRHGIPWEHVEPVLGQLSATVKAMVLLQYYTGARSDSICNATVGQFTRVDDLLEWRPKHKTEHLGVELVIPIGPRCQAVLEPFLNGPADRPLFSPRRQRRNRRYNVFYRSSAYYRAVTRAQGRVNDERTEKSLPTISAWTPHQLRHALGKSIRDEFGVEAAQAMLGHASLQATQIYSERRLELARTIARQRG